MFVGSWWVLGFAVSKLAYTFLDRGFGSFGHLEWKAYGKHALRRI
jgi:hypothetical protein